MAGLAQTMGGGSAIVSPELQPVKVETVDSEPETAPASDAAAPEAVEATELLTEAQETELVDARMKRRRVNPETAARNDMRRRILKELVNCPVCGVSLHLRCLAWWHVCTPERDLREQLLKSAHDAFYRPCWPR
jgi:hypothetical protein